MPSLPIKYPINMDFGHCLLCRLSISLFLLLYVISHWVWLLHAQTHLHEYIWQIHDLKRFDPLFMESIINYRSSRNFQIDSGKQTNKQLQ